MTAGTTIMGHGRATDQGVIVTAATAGSTDRDDAAVVRLSWVQLSPVRSVAGGTVTTSGKGLAHSQADQSTTVGVMATGARIVYFRICQIGQRRRITVARVAAIRAGDGHQGCMIRSFRVSRFPAVSVTGGAITTGGKGLADCVADQSTAVGVMTAAAIIMNLRINPVDERGGIAVAVATTSQTDGYQSRMVRCCGVVRLPATSMAAAAITRCGLADSKTD